MSDPSAKTPLGRRVSVEDIALLEASLRVVQAGMHLVENGFGRLAFLPYVGGAGYWRCEFHVLGYPSRVLYRYSQGAGSRYLEDHAGGSVRRDIMPEALAKAIMVSVPAHLREQCEGDVDPLYFAWLKEFRHRLYRAPCLPVAFHEYSADTSRWEIRPLERLDEPGEMVAPPPSYVYPGDERAAEEEPFWRERLGAWDLLAQEASVTVPTRMVENCRELDEIGIRLCQEVQGMPAGEAAEVFRRAFKVAVVSLRGPGIDAGKLLVALRESGLEPVLVRLDEGHVVALALAGIEHELSEQEFETERLRRLGATLQSMGLQADPATLKLVEAMCAGALVEALLAERQHDKLAAQKEAASIIRQAKKG
jgi:hypothetical protein